MTINYELRSQSLISHLEKEEINLAVITDPSNIYYMTGFYADPHERYMSVCIDTKRTGTCLFLPARDKEIAGDSAKVDHVIPRSDEQDPITIIKDTLAGTPNMIGIEMNI